MKKPNPTTRLEVIRITSKKDFHDLKEKWSDLLSASRADNFFLTWDWMFHWWEVYREGKELFLLVLKDQEGNMRGLAPLYLRTAKIKHLNFRELLFIGSGESPYPDYLDIIAEKGWEKRIARAIAEYIITYTLRWHFFNVVNINIDNTCLNILLEELNQKSSYIINTIETEKAYLIELPSSWEQYLSSLSRNSRSNIKKRRNRLQRKMDVGFYWVNNPEDTETALEIMAGMHQERMEEKNLQGKFTDPRYMKFHLKIASATAELGKLNLCFLLLNGKKVAVRYGFVYKDTVYDYQCGYDPVYGKYEVGNVLLSYIIEAAIKKKVQKFDFLSGDYQFKQSLSNKTRETAHIMVVNCFGKGLLYYLGLKRRSFLT